VSYASNTATFTPGAPVAGVFTPALLETGKTYTAKINGATAPAATDTSGNPLALAGFPLAAADYIWSFVTAVGAPPPPGATVVLSSTNPANLGTVCSTSGINATFGVAMDPATVNAGTFTLTEGTPPLNVTAASVVLDGTGKIATFTPFSALTPGVTYTATIKNGASGVKDLTGNTLALPPAPNPWTFTAATVGPTCAAPEPLGAASTFGIFSGISFTNEGDDPNSRITGNLGINGATSSIKGLHDSVPVSYSETCPTAGAAVGCGLVTGVIYATGVTSTAVVSAAQLAFNNLSPAGRPGGLAVETCPGCGGIGGGAGELGGRTLAPGIYKSTPGTYGITSGDLTLDAQGNANAVWIFQAATSLTVGPTGPLNVTHNSVILINGAQAKNVFWYVGSAATINTGSNMVGNIISSAATTFGTSDARNPPPAVAITTLNGRATSLGAGVTMVNTHIIVPAP